MINIFIYYLDINTFFILHINYFEYKIYISFFIY